MRSRLLGAASVTLSLLLWEISVRAGWVDNHYLSPPSEIAPTLARIIRTGEITPHLVATLERVYSGFAAGVALGVALGVACALWDPVYEFFSPVMESARAVPPLALLPVFLIFFGIGFRFAFAVILWVAWVPIFYNTVHGIRSVPRDVLEAASVDGANSRQKIRHIILPLSLPAIVTGTRLGMGAAFLVVSAAETIGAPTGLGFYIYNDSQTFHIPEMYAALVLFGAVAWATNAVLVGIANLVSRRVSS